MKKSKAVTNKDREKWRKAKLYDTKADFWSARAKMKKIKEKEECTFKPQIKSDVPRTHYRAIMTKNLEIKAALQEE